MCKKSVVDLGKFSQGDNPTKHMSSTCGDGIVSRPKLRP